MPGLPEIAATAGISLDLRLVSSGSSRGPEWVGPCPGCGGDDRFHVWPEQHVDRGGSYWCRGCGAGGDGIQFLRDFGKLSFKDACRIVGKELPDRPGGSSGSGFNATKRRPWKSTPILPPQINPAGSSILRPRICEPPPKKWMTQAKKYVLEAKAALMSNRLALEKLQRERGMTPQSAALFNLGLLLPREKSGLTCRFSSRNLWGLPPNESAKKPDSLWLPRGLIIPCPVPGSNISVNATETAKNADIQEFCRLRIRRHPDDIKSGGSKYYVVPGSSTAPLLIHNQQPAIVICESELDAILIYQQAGDLVGVCALGNAQSRPDQATATKLREVPLIILAFDNDAAGAAAAAKWEQWFDHCEKLTLPDGIKDPGELHHAGGDLREWIKSALPSPWRETPRKITARQPANIPAPSATADGGGLLPVPPPPPPDDAWECFDKMPEFDYPAETEPPLNSAPGPEFGSSIQDPAPEPSGAQELEFMTF